MGIMDILAITTGGTIGALPHPDPSQAPRICTMPADHADPVREALTVHFTDYKTRHLAFEARDSNLIDTAYRLKILAAIIEAPEQAVLITHGTDTILATADFLYQACLENPAAAKKSIILTGSMVPLANGAGYDGYDNLAFSLKLLVMESLASLSLVLCDFDSDGFWTPHLYTYQPNRFEKFYDPDSRYSRIRELAATAVA